MKTPVRLLLFVCVTVGLLLLALMVLADLLEDSVYLESKAIKFDDQFPTSHVPENLNHIYNNTNSVIQVSKYFEHYNNFLKRRATKMPDWKTAYNTDFQQQVVDKFCARHGMNDISFEIPYSGWNDRARFFKHILFDDNTKLIFAYLPKVASSHIRRFVCVLSKIFPVGTVFSKTVSVKKMERCVHNCTFLNRNLEDFDRIKRMKTYWKVAILRNPLERLVSAYRDKIVGSKRKAHEREWLREIKSMFNVTDVDFDIYLQWIIEKPNKFLNEHFAPSVFLTNPCIVRYNYYGNFKRLSEEMKLISGHLHVHRRLFTDFDYHSSTNRTENLVAKYFSKATAATKKKLFWDFYMEFDFYFSLFPEDINTMKLLQLNESFF